MGFRKAIAESHYAGYACSVLPQHVHLVFGPHSRNIRRIAGHLKARATQQLESDDLHPLASFRQRDGAIPSPWGRNSWCVFIFSEGHMRAAIKYVTDNPLKEGKRQQRWSFVSEYLNGSNARRSKLRG
jgi:hypothetical protein